MQINKTKKWIGMLSSALVATVLLAACGARTTASQDLTKAAKVTVGTGSVENRIVATGKVVARADVNVAFQRGGIVTEVLVKEGQQVKAGDKLATLDTTDLDLTAQQQFGTSKFETEARADTNSLSGRRNEIILAVSDFRREAFKGKIE